MARAIGELILVPHGLSSASEYLNERPWDAYRRNQDYSLSLAINLLSSPTSHTAFARRIKENVYSRGW